MQNADDDDCTAHDAIEDEMPACRQAAIAGRDRVAWCAHPRTPPELSEVRGDQCEISLRLCGRPFTFGIARDRLEIGSRGGRNDEAHQSRAINCSMSSSALR